MTSLFSLGTEPSILQNKAISPTWITTSPIPRSPALQVFVTVLKRFKWVNIFLVHDSSASSGYGLVRDLILTALRANNIDVTSISVNSKISNDFTGDDLQVFQRKSRGTIHIYVLYVY